MGSPFTQKFHTPSQKYVMTREDIRNINKNVRPGDFHLDCEIYDCIEVYPPIQEPVYDTTLERLEINTAILPVQDEQGIWRFTFKVVPLPIQDPIFDPNSNVYTPEQAEIEIQNQLDIKARSFGYDNIVSAASYATSTHPKFGPEGKAFVAWRDSVWSWSYNLLGEVASGTQPAPVFNELRNVMPQFPGVDYDGDGTIDVQ